MILEVPGSFGISIACGSDSFLGASSLSARCIGATLMILEVLGIGCNSKLSWGWSIDRGFSFKSFWIWDNCKLFGWSTGLLDVTFLNMIKNKLITEIQPQMMIIDNENLDRNKYKKEYLFTYLLLILFDEDR